MARVIASLVAVALCAAAALGVSSCGEDDAQLLAGNTAREIRENLEAVQQLAEEGECVGAEDEALQVSIQVEGLQGIDPKLKQALEDGAAKLNEVVDTCEEEPQETTEETEPATTESAKEQEEREKEEEKAAKEAEKEEEKAAKDAEQEEEKAAKEAEKEEEKAQKEQEKEEKEQAKEEPPPSDSGGIGPGGEAGGGD